MSKAPSPRRPINPQANEERQNAKLSSGSWHVREGTTPSNVGVEISAPVKSVHPYYATSYKGERGLFYKLLYCDNCHNTLYYLCSILECHNLPFSLNSFPSQHIRGSYCAVKLHSQLQLQNGIFKLDSISFLGKLEYHLENCL